MNATMQVLITISGDIEPEEVAARVSRALTHVTGIERIETGWVGR